MKKRWLVGALAALGGVLGLAGTAAAQDTGYWMLEENGAVHAFGGAPHRGHHTTDTASDIESTPSGNGYYITDRFDVRPFGDARELPFVGGRLGEHASLVSVSATKGSGYWLFDSWGCAAAFGDATWHGDMCFTPLNAPIIASAVTPSGNGYYMIGADGGVFTFGDARFFGSTGSMRLNQPVNGIAVAPGGNGYWLVARDGGIFSFGPAAPFYGSMGGVRLNKPVSGMVSSPTGGGYLMVAEDGGIFTFGDVPFHGSLGGNPPPRPIVAVAAKPVSRPSAVFTPVEPPVTPVEPDEPTPPPPSDSCLVLGRRPSAGWIEYRLTVTNPHGDVRDAWVDVHGYVDGGRVADDFDIIDLVGPNERVAEDSFFLGSELDGIDPARISCRIAAVEWRVPS